jgi:hypothetical protein
MSDTLPIEAPPSAADERGIDPVTQKPWSRLLDTEVTERCLAVRHGIKRARQTLAHDRSTGTGIRWMYSGQKPVTTLAEIDRYAREDALKPNSPLSEKARARHAARRAQRQSASAQQGVAPASQPHGRPPKRAQSVKPPAA